MNFTRTVLELGDTFPCAPRLDQAFFSFYALLLYHIINLFQISVSCFPCLCQSSPCLSLYLQLLALPMIQEVDSFSHLSRLLSFYVSSFGPDLVGSNTTYVLLHAAFISVLFPFPFNSFIKMKYSIGAV